MSVDGCRGCDVDGKCFRDGCTVCCHCYAPIEREEMDQRLPYVKPNAVSFAPGDDGYDELKAIFDEGAFSIDHEKQRLKQYVRARANGLHDDLCGVFNTHRDGCSFYNCTCRNACYCGVRAAWGVIHGIPSDRLNWPETD